MSLAVSLTFWFIYPHQAESTLHEQSLGLPAAATHLSCLWSDHSATTTIWAESPTLIRGGSRIWKRRGRRGIGDFLKNLEQKGVYVRPLPSGSAPADHCVIKICWRQFETSQSFHTKFPSEWNLTTFYMNLGTMNNIFSRPTMLNVIVLINLI